MSCSYPCLLDGWLTLRKITQKTGIVYVCEIWCRLTERDWGMCSTEYQSSSNQGLFHVVQVQRIVGHCSLDIGSQFWNPTLCLKYTFQGSHPHKYENGTVTHPPWWKMTKHLNGEIIWLKLYQLLFPISQAQLVWTSVTAYIIILALN